MKRCKHCGRRYSQPEGRGDFCCSGCEHVYAMIQENGLGGYYERQDQVGQPPESRPLAEADVDVIREQQMHAEEAGGAELALGVQGMTCMGCAWLIEELARRRRGVRFARVALQSNRLFLGWKPGSFDLCEFAEELHRFGYKMSEPSASSGYTMSPLAMRLCLTLAFSLNGLLLSVAAGMGIGGEGLEYLYTLMILFCLLFAQFIGGAVFLKPAWRGLQLRRLHSDLLPAVLLFVLFITATGRLLLADAGEVAAVLYFMLLSALVFARWLSERLALKRSA